MERNDMYNDLEHVARLALARGKTSEGMYRLAYEQERGGREITADFTRAKAAIMAKLEEEGYQS